MIDYPVLRPAELPDSPLLDLDASGMRVAPLVFVDLTAPPCDGAVVRASAPGCVLVGLAPAGLRPESVALAQQLACTLVEVVESSPCEVRVADVGSEARHLVATAARSPRAAGVLVDLLRLTARLPVREGLLAESLAYSMLLAGPEFLDWRRSTPVRPSVDTGPFVRVHRTDDVLLVVLDRPGRHNAYDRRVRGELVQALEIAVADPALRVRLTGAGKSFCSGGDLAEFGSTPDVVVAHQVRTTQSAGLLMHQLGNRLEVEIHGACIGAGVELPAFADRVRAHPDVRLVLPELAMGLVPGAGGTVSLVRRMGRWRTAYLALSGRPLGVTAALAWGLVDEVVGPPGATAANDMRTGPGKLVVDFSS